ncbi:MAG TPA: hypothetical protein DEZ08_03750 [Dehalococcoidia bacterium]|jgi:pimeloyl-ACP methyl ester carboxylesterase|nr:hypothetical protein [Dehalococcoidia bacterium]
MSVDFQLETIKICNTEIEMLTGGSGKSLLVLHGPDGSLGWLNYAKILAEKYKIYIPSHPGFGNSNRPEWILNIQDMACFYTWFIEEIGLQQCNVLGFSIGGWIAAEILSIAPNTFNKVILTSSAGIKPKKSDITDIFLLSPNQIAESSFKDISQAPEYTKVYGNTEAPSGTHYITGSTGGYDPQFIADKNRETAVRLCWKPYMFDPKLPAILNRVKNPVQIIWGENDSIIPQECGEIFAQSIPNSTLNIIKNCGHMPHIEKTTEFTSIVTSFLE